MIPPSLEDDAVPRDEMRCHFGQICHSITPGGHVKKVVGWIILGLIVLWVINNPHHAADLVEKTGHAISTLAHLN
jgi:hypothetical protein